MCLLAVTYSDSSTMSQAEVPLERIHAFYLEMGPFNTIAYKGTDYVLVQLRGVVTLIT